MINYKFQTQSMWENFFYSCKSIVSRFDPYVLSSKSNFINYIKETFFLVTLKYMWHVGMNSKKLNLKVKHQTKFKNLCGYFLVHLPFYLPI
jgi:hypothetical protein